MELSILMRTPTAVDVVDDVVLAALLPPLVVPSEVEEEAEPRFCDVRAALDRLLSSEPVSNRRFEETVSRAHAGVTIGRGTKRRLRQFVRAYAVLVDHFASGVPDRLVERMRCEWYWLRWEIAEAAADEMQDDGVVPHEEVQ